VSGRVGDTRDMRAQHFLGFPLDRPALFDISTLPPGNMGIFTFTPAGRKKVASTLQPSLKTKHSVQV